MSRAGAEGIPVEVLRDALEREGVHLPDLARAMGWYERKPDTARLKRTLGMRSVSHKRQRGSTHPYQEHVSYDVAQQIVLAAGIDPHLVGV